MTLAVATTLIVSCITCNGIKSVSDPNEDTAVYPVMPEFADAFFAPRPSAVPFAFGAASHVGNVRSQNEDRFAVFRLRRALELIRSSLATEDLSVPDTHSYAMVAVDGMGGMKSGEMASRLALQTMVELSSQATSWVMKFTDLNAQQIEQRVGAYVKRIHAALQQHGQANPEMHNMGTTWTSAHLLGRHAVVVHLGDSRAYRYRDGKLSQVTRDETMAQGLIDAGMDPDSVSKFNHVLVNSFGGGNENAVATIHSLDFDPDDSLLLCTDGLTDMVAADDIAKELGRHSTPQAACDALVELALANGGKDNVTVVLAMAGPNAD
jgi:protein phosphatase